MAESHVWIQSSKYYSSDKLLDILLNAALEKSPVEDIASRSVISPSPDTVMKKLAQTPCARSRIEIEDTVTSIFQKQVGKHLMFKRRSIPRVSIDL